MRKLHSLDGFKGLDLDSPEIQAIQKKNAEQGEEIYRLIHRVFRQTEDGEKLLDLWQRQFLMQPVCPPGRDEGHGYFREGQNDFLRQILQNCEQAEKLK